MTDPLLLLAVPLVGAAAYVGTQTWRRLRYRCARVPALVWFVGLNVVFAASAGMTYLYGEPVFAGIAISSVLVASALDGLSIRLLGGPDLIKLQFRLRAISGMLLPEVRTEQSITSARAWARDLLAVRTPETRRVIDAVNAAIDAGYGPDSGDIGASNAAWKEYQSAVVELQSRVGPPRR